MIIVQIKGGLGNQLFTYAAAYGIAMENNTEVVLDRYIYDTSYDLRKYMLNNFPAIIDKPLISSVPTQNKIIQFVYKLARKFKLKYLYNVRAINEKEEFTFININSNGENLYLNGYWQSYRFFNKYRDALVQKLTPLVNLDQKGNSLLFEIEKRNSVAIHIRRGDYVNFKGGKCLSNTYYLEAIKNLKEKKGNDLQFYVFTDDIDYCKNTFNNIGDITFVADKSKLNDIEEFYLMTKCKNFIIGNSSFSWWAAYIGENNETSVIAPVVDMWKEEFYLPDWIKLEADLE